MKLKWLISTKYLIYEMVEQLQHKHDKHLKFSYRKCIFPDWDIYQTVTYEKRQKCAIKTIVTAVQEHS